MSGANEILAKLFETSKVSVAAGAKDVTIRKVTLRTMKPVIDLLAAIIEDLKLTSESLPSLDLKDPSVILKLISKFYDQTLDTVLPLTDLSRDELLDMDPDDSVLVIQSVVLLNKDFFTKKVLPNLNALGFGASAN